MTDAVKHFGRRLAGVRITRRLDSHEAASTTTTTTSTTAADGTAAADKEDDKNIFVKKKLTLREQYQASYPDQLLSDEVIRSGGFFVYLFLMMYSFWGISLVT
jgi:hypothetical protein